MPRTVPHSGIQVFTQLPAGCATPEEGEYEYGFPLMGSWQKALQFKTLVNGVGQNSAPGWIAILEYDDLNLAAGQAYVVRACARFSESGWGDWSDKSAPIQAGSAPIGSPPFAAAGQHYWDQRVAALKRWDFFLSYDAELGNDLARATPVLLAKGNKTVISADQLSTTVLTVTTPPSEFEGFERSGCVLLFLTADNQRAAVEMRLSADIRAIPEGSQVRQDFEGKFVDALAKLKLAQLWPSRVELELGPDLELEPKLEPEPEPGPEQGLGPEPEPEQFRARARGNVKQRKAVDIVRCIQQIVASGARAHTASAHTNPTITRPSDLVALIVPSFGLKGASRPRASSDGPDPQWLRDEYLQNCMMCRKAFWDNPGGVVSAFSWAAKKITDKPPIARTRHHCRCCGWVLCQVCCPEDQLIPLDRWISSTDPGQDMTCEPGSTINEARDETPAAETNTKRVFGSCVACAPREVQARLLNPKQLAFLREIPGGEQAMEKAAEAVRADEMESAKDELVSKYGLSPSQMAELAAWAEVPVAQERADTIVCEYIRKRGGDGG